MSEHGWAQLSLEKLSPEALSVYLLAVVSAPMSVLLKARESTEVCNCEFACLNESDCRQKTRTEMNKVDLLTYHQLELASVIGSASLWAFCLVLESVQGSVLGRRKRV